MNDNIDRYDKNIDFAAILKHFGWPNFLYESSAMYVAKNNFVRNISSY
jgi:hypothetical protein